MKASPAYYSIIPATVRYDNDLKANEKLLYGEITALANQNGYCWAENQYFAELYGVKKRTVSGWVSKLERKGYIKTELFYQKGTKQVSKRHIYINDTPMEEKSNRVGNKSSIPSGKNVPHPMEEKSKEELNITRSNITSTNNDNNNGSEKETPKSENQTQKPKKQNTKEVHRFYQENFGIESQYIAQEIEYLVEDLSIELVLEAMKRAIEYGKEFGYAKRIMNNWIKKNIDSMEKVEQADVEFERQNQNRFNKSNNKQQSKQMNKEPIPDWANKENKDKKVTETNNADEPVDPRREGELQNRLDRLKKLREEKGVQND